MTITQLKQEIIHSLQASTESPLPITEQTHLIRDLGLSSMETMMVVTDLEDRFGIQIPAKRLRSVQTVSDLTEIIIDTLKQ